VLCHEHYRRAGVRLARMVVSHTKQLFKSLPVTGVGTATGSALVLVVKFKAYVAMLRCWCTSPDAREKK